MEQNIVKTIKKQGFEECYAQRLIEGNVSRLRPHKL